MVKEPRPCSRFVRGFFFPLSPDFCRSVGGRCLDECEWIVLLFSLGAGVTAQVGLEGGRRWRTESKANGRGYRERASQRARGAV